MSSRVLTAIVVSASLLSFEQTKIPMVLSSASTPRSFVRLTVSRPGIVDV